MSSRPASQRSNGGIDCVASSWISAVNAPMSYASNAVNVALEELGVRRVHGGRGCRRPASLASSVARARWSALLTDATLVSRSSATSAAFQRSTSHRMRTARWRGGSCWSAATKASRTDSRAPTISAGSPASGTTRPSGIGSIQSWSGVCRFSTIGRAGRAEIHRPRPSLAALEHVEADVRRDPVEPRAKRRAALEAVVRTPGPDERLLHGVLGVAEPSIR